MDAGISAMLMARQMRPPFSFWSYPKRERAAPGVREKGALAATLHVRAKLLYGGRREMVPAGLRWLPDGRGGVRYRLDGGFPRRGCVLGRGARTHLTSSSFRAFRFATRYPGGRRGLCFRADEGIGPLHQLPRGTASGSEKRSSSMRRPPRRGRNHPPRDGSCKLAEAPSVPEGQAKSALAPIRRFPSRAEGHCTGAR